LQDLTGQTLDRYLLTERLGIGGMAAVFKAYQQTLDRYVAVKILHPLVAADETFLARFRREARAVAALRHPHIVQVYDFGNDGDRYYMAMEYVEGLTLKQRLEALRQAGECMPVGEAVRIAIQVADALAYAHEQGMVHRDVKPGNILVEKKGRVVLSDFGIVHMMEGTRYTLTSILGTPDYMSPEQGMGQPVDGRSDIYSLGAVLYEMLTGRVPFTADTLLAVIFKHVQEPLPPLRAINPDVPEAVEQVVVKAMAKKPGERFATANDMAEALQAALATSKAGEPLPRPDSRAAITPVLDMEQARARAPQHRLGRLSRANSFIAGSLLALLGVGVTMLIVSLTMKPAAVLPTLTPTAWPISALATIPAAPPPTATYTRLPPTTTPTDTPGPPSASEATPMATRHAKATRPPDTPTPTTSTEAVAPVYKYAAPLLTEPISNTTVAGPLIFLRWQPVAEQLAPDEWYAIRLVYFHQGQAVYQGDRLQATEWRLPQIFYHQADGPELQYIWYVFVERQNPDGSTEQLSPESEHITFRWE
jgi:serine/threonine protein kinase